MDIEGGQEPVEQPVEPAVEQPELPLGEKPVEQQTLRDHEALFGPPGAVPLTEEEEAAREAVRPKRTHRSRSSQAGPEDVPRIAKLTKELRSREERIAELERQVSTPAPPAARVEPSTPLPRPAPAAPSRPATLPAGVVFPEAEPTQEQFSAEADPYLAYTRAWARWDRRKDQWEDEARDYFSRQTQQQEQSQQQIIQHRQQIYTGYQEKVPEFVQQRPDFAEKLKVAEEWPVTELLIETMLSEGPDLVYALIDSPWIYDEALLQTVNKPVTPELVSSTRRWLRSKVSGVQAGNTGAAVPSRVVQQPPRPATPVRTGPVRSADQPPDEKSSLREHESYWHNPERVGRRR